MQSSTMYLLTHPSASAVVNSWPIWFVLYIHLQPPPFHNNNLKQILYIKNPGYQNHIISCVKLQYVYLKEKGCENIHNKPLMCMKLNKNSLKSGKSWCIKFQSSYPYHKGFPLVLLFCSLNQDSDQAHTVPVDAFSV